MLWFSKIVVGKSQWDSSHHCEVSKKCPKLLPSPGFEPRPFSVSVQAYHAMLDTVSIRYVYSVATVRYKMLPEEEGLPGDVNTLSSTPMPYRPQVWLCSSIDVANKDDEA